MRDLLNSGEAGNFRCVNTNVEVGQVARDDTARGMRSIPGSLAASTRLLTWRATVPGKGTGWCATVEQAPGSAAGAARRAEASYRQDGRKVVVRTLSVLVP